MFRKKNSMAETVGRIVDMTPDWIRYEMGGNGPIQAVPFFVSSHNAGDMYPVYEYTAGGRTYRKAARVARGYNQVQRAIGQLKTVRYNPEKPEDSKLVW